MRRGYARERRFWRPKKGGLSPWLNRPDSKRKRRKKNEKKKFTKSDEPCKKNLGGTETTTSLLTMNKNEREVKRERVPGGGEKDLPRSRA